MRPVPDLGMLKLEAEADTDTVRISAVTAPLIELFDISCEVGGMCPTHARIFLMQWLCSDLGAAGWTPEEVAECAAEAARWGDRMAGDGRAGRGRGPG